MDPVTYPTIKLNGQEIELKFRQYDIIALAKAGVDLFKLDKLPLLSALGIERNITLVQHAIAHQVEMTTDEISKCLDFGSVVEVDQKLGESIKKAVSQITAAMQQQPNQSSEQVQ